MLWWWRAPTRRTRSRVEPDLISGMRDAVFRRGLGVRADHAYSSENHVELTAEIGEAGLEAREKRIEDRTKSNFG